MELPNVGKHCSWKECNTLDFLPFTCKNCQHIFCKEHFQTFAHDCQCLNEFFKKEQTVESIIFHKCNKEDCADKSAVELLCSHCNKHFCIAHRHHGCQDGMLGKELRAAKVKEWKKPKEEFKVAKEEADKKVELTLRKAAAESSKSQVMAQKIRLMKLKSKALGDNKIPIDNRIYFSVYPPPINNAAQKPVSLFTSKDWSVGRSIDLFSTRLRIANKNNVPSEPKLRLFKFNDGALLSATTDAVMGTLFLDNAICNGDSLILQYVKPADLSDTNKIDADLLEKYRSVAIV